MPVVLVAPARWARWTENFTARHGELALDVVEGGLTGVADDGSTFAARLPLDAAYDGPAALAALADAVVLPAHWGVLLVRKGGFAIARIEAGRIAASKVGRRHVQGRTKAGGQSQQRFARRRDNQARAAFEAAGEHAVVVLEGGADARPPLPVVVGGDRTAVDDVLADRRLAHLRPVGPWFGVPDPRRDVLEATVEQAGHLVVDVHNADGS